MGNIVDMHQNRMAIKAYQSKVSSQLKLGVYSPTNLQQTQKHASEVGLLTKSKPFDMLDVMV